MPLVKLRRHKHITQFPHCFGFLQSQYAIKKDNQSVRHSNNGCEKGDAFHNKLNVSVCLCSCTFKILSRSHVDGSYMTKPVLLSSLWPSYVQFSTDIYVIFLKSGEFHSLVSAGKLVFFLKLFAYASWTISFISYKPSTLKKCCRNSDLLKCRN